MVKGSEIGDFGGSSPESPRQWLGVQWLGLILGVAAIVRWKLARTLSYTYKLPPRMELPGVR